MQNFLFHCSRLGLLVQGSVAKSKLPEAGVLVPYDCPACGGVHIVDPRKQETERSTRPRRSD